MALPPGIELPTGMALPPGVTRAPSDLTPAAPAYAPPSAPPVDFATQAAPMPPPAPPMPPPAAPVDFATPAATMPPPTQEFPTQSYPPPSNGTVYEPPAAQPAGYAPYEPPVESPMDQVEHDTAYTRVALEEDSKFEAGLLANLLVEVQDSGASDLHLTSGARPTLRINGSLTPLEEHPLLTPPVIQRMIYAILTQKQRENFEEELELDFAYALPGRARFRVNIYRQRDSVGPAFRIIPYEIKTLEELGVPPGVANFAMLPRGFVLVTGPTGSGKSTTLAALVDLANRSRRDHIMTVEDPIEFLHAHKSCLVNQREVGEDTWSFQNALKHVLRQDPDIILVGEMRDLETISVALTAAETGHLVFATLHTQDAAQTIDRVIDVFPPHQQQQIRVQLAGALQGIICQTLAKTFDGKGRAVATEVLVATPAIRNLVREGKTHQIYSSLQAGAKHGMHTLDQHLAELVKSGRITYETALEKCHHVEDFNRLTGRG
jgi:twitching motility protein PilT